MAAEGSETVARRLDEAIQHLHDLGRRVDDMNRRLVALEKGAPPAEPVDRPRLQEVKESESVWAWLGQSRFLPRLAMVCFVLVLALVLRTLTSSGIIDLELGVWLGIGYSAGLVAVGWRALARKRRGRRVLPACGAVLMCTVVLEGFGPFEQLSAPAANWILAVTIAVVATLGIRHRAEALVAITVLSATVSALALGFPQLAFPYTAVVLFAANLAVLAFHTRGLRWLAWVTFGVTLFFWLVWSFKLNVALHRDPMVPESLYLNWYLPFLALFTLLYATVGGARAFAAPHAPGPFYVFLPTGNALWSYAAAFAVVAPWTGTTAALGICGVAVSLAHLGVAGWLWHRQHRCALGITAFVLAGTVLLVVAMPSALGRLPFALPLWSAAALGLGVTSAKCSSTGLRVASYLLQLVTCVYAVSAGVLAVPSPAALTSIVVAAILTTIAAAHYRWARRHPPEPGTWLTRIDPRDQGAVLLLWIATVGGFCLLRVPTYSAIDALGVDVDNAFDGAQSVIINLVGIGLMLWGIARKDGQVLATAGLVAILGGLKVFGSDLLAITGLPLVFAVFSFGLTAAVGSVVLGKWQAYTRQDQARAGGPAGSE